MLIKIKFAVLSPKEVSVTVTSPTGGTTVNFHTTNGHKWILKPDTQVSQITKPLKSNKLKPAQFVGFYKAFFSKIASLIPTLTAKDNEPQFDFTDCPEAFLKAGPFEEYAKTNNQKTLKDILRPLIDFMRIKTAYSRHHFFAGLKNSLGQLLHRDSLGIAYLSEQYESQVKNPEEGLFVLLHRIAKFVNKYAKDASPLINQRTILKILNEVDDHFAVRDIAAQLHELSQKPELTDIYTRALSRAAQTITTTNRIKDQEELLQFVLEKAAAQKEPVQTRRLSQ